MQKATNGNVLILKKQEIVLIKNSEEVKNVELYGNLFSSLETYTKLSKSNLNKDIVFDDKAKLALLNNKDILMKNVNTEWYAKESYLIAEEEVHCQLCGAKNTYVCYIVNRKNGNELNVGRECVKNYTNINGTQIVIDKINKVERDMKKEARRVEFELLEGEEVDFLHKPEDDIENFPMMIPIKIYRALKDSLSTCNRLKRSYINNNGNIYEIFEKYKLSKTQFKSSYTDALNYYQSVRTNPLICDYRVSKWVQENIPTIESYIRDRKGLLDEISLKFIYDNKFCEDKLTDFRNYISKGDICIVNIEGTVMRFSIKNKLFVQPVTFTMKLSEFMKKIGSYCLTNKEFIFDRKMLNDILIENTNANFQAVYNSISNILKKYGYDFIIDYRTSQAFWEKRQVLKTQYKWRKHGDFIQPVYKKTSKEYLLRIATNFILLDENELLEHPQILTSKIEKNGMWITKEEKNKYINDAISAAGIQKQKEYTSYL